MPLDDDSLQKVYTWVDEVPLSRPKRNISRDFSDAEIVAHYHPKLVEIHNYIACSSIQQKLHNWNTLNQKVLRRLNCQLSKHQLEDIVNAKNGAIEEFLLKLQTKIAQYSQRKVSGDRSTLESPPKSARNNPETSSISSQPSNLESSKSTAYHQEQPNDNLVRSLKETIEILELKIIKLEQLVRLKDGKIQALTSKIEALQVR